MEKAFAELELDWTVITVEVPEKDLSLAMDGMFAMQFMAIRIYPSLQIAAVKHFEAASHSARFVGRITSAALTPTGWTCWHNQGFAIREIVAGKHDLEQCVFWLVGDSVRCRSLAVALQDKRLPRAVFWSDAPVDLADGICKLKFEESRLDVQLISASEAVDAIAALLNARQGNSIVVVGDDWESIPRQAWELDTGVLTEDSICLISTTDPAGQALARLNRTGLIAIGDVDEVIHCEAYDFRRWSHHEPDISLLRDAYDEYCDF
jgi:hypothetical protein